MVSVGNGLAISVFVSIVAVWSSSAFVGRSGLQRSSTGANEVITKSYQLRKKRGITSIAAKGASMKSTEQSEAQEFALGRQVVLLGPSKLLAGQTGTIVAPALGESFAVRVKSGSVFHIHRTHLKGTGLDAAREQDVDQEAYPLFSPGQQVVLLAPPRLAQKTGSIVGVAGGEDFAVRLSSGSIFNIRASHLEAATPAGNEGSLGASTAPVEQSIAERQPTSEEEDDIGFSLGKQVVLLAPPKLAGKVGTVVRPALGDTLEVQLESGSVFNIQRKYLKRAQQAESPGASFQQRPASQRPVKGQTQDGSASNMATSGSDSLAAGGIGNGGAGGVGNGGSGFGGGGAGKPPGDARSDHTQPQHPWSRFWIAVAILCVVTEMGYILCLRRERHKQTPLRVDRRLAKQAGASTNINPIIMVFFLLAAAVVSNLATRLAFWVRQVLPEDGNTFSHHLHDTLASVSEAKIAQAALQIEADQETPMPGGLRLHHASLLVLLVPLAYVLRIIILSFAARTKQRAGSDVPQNIDLVKPQEIDEVVKDLEEEGDEEEETEEEEEVRDEIPNPLQDCPEVHLRCMVLASFCRLVVAGDCETTGEWDAEKSTVELRSDRVSHPFWTGKWNPRAQTSPREFEFKLVLIRPDGGKTWESVGNRRLQVKPRERVTVELTFDSEDMQVIRETGSKAVAKKRQKPIVPLQSDASAGN